MPLVSDYFTCESTIVLMFPVQIYASLARGVTPMLAI